MDSNAGQSPVGQPPRAALYFDASRPEQVQGLCAPWLDGSLRLLCDVFGTDWAGRWYVGHTMPDFSDGPQRHQTDPHMLVEHIVDGSMLGHASVSFDEPYPSPLQTARVNFERFGDGHQYLMLHTALAFVAPDEQLAHEVAAGLLRLVEAVAGPGRPSYGEISPSWGGQEPATRLDLMLRRYEDVSAAEALDALRGYEWVTACPASLIAGLGGAAAIRSTGAFHRVIELPHGAILQATEHPEQFDQEAAARVWQALRPILPAGQPKPLDVFNFWPLVMHDAALTA